MSFELSPPTVIQWIVDTRNFWQVNGKDGSVADLKIHAAKALSLLTEDERLRALKFYHSKDAKMSIVSHLLKRMAIVELCRVPWDRAIVSKLPNHKPYFLNTALGTADPNISFNVSHQAGIVTLVAISKASIDVGTDVVCANERGNVDKDKDFFDWVSAFSDVFHPNEMEYMQRNSSNLNLDFPPAMSMPVSECKHRGRTLRAGSFEIASDSVVDEKVRRFYAYWCLHEAFIKMQGEALLADWLKELDFRNLRAPKPQANVEDIKAEGEVIKDFQVFLKGKAYPDVVVELRALGQHYMVATVMHSDTDKDAVPRSLPGFIHLGEDDIYAASGKF